MAFSVNKVISDVVNSKFMKKHIHKSMHDPKFLTGVLVATSVAKDVVGYGTRIITDSRNKRIPEDKKHFLTDMNITNAIVSTAAQLGVALVVSSDCVQKNITEKLFSPVKNHPKIFKAASRSFLILSTLLASTVLAKRLIVPIVATPIASAVYRKKEDRLHPKTSPN